MLLRETLRAGPLQETLADLQQEIRKNPALVPQRVFMFQLLAVMGEWQRALTQLNIAGELDAGTLLMVHSYRELLKCELLREEVFAGRRASSVLGEPEPWIGTLIQALQLGAESRYEQSLSLRAKAFDAASPLGGHIDGEKFAWIADADERTGPMLEVMLNGRLYWVPFSGIARLSIEQPIDLRDCVWLPVHIAWRSGGEVAGFVPTRYPGTAASDDDSLRLAHKTIWDNPYPGVFLGLGQRILVTDAGEHPIMDIRLIEFDPIAKALETIPAAPGKSQGEPWPN